MKKNGSIMNSIDVLVADDEEITRTVLQDGLAAHGITVRTATNGKSAVLESLRQTPDAVLMDVLMPSLSGLDALGLFKIIEPLRNVPVLMLTVLSSREDVMVAMRAGSRDYISKPFDLKETAAHIRQILSCPLPAPFPIFRFLSYTASSDGQGIRLELEGDLTAPMVEDLRILIRAMSPIQPIRIDLDFEKVSSVGEGLRSSLIGIREMAESVGGKIFICQLDKKKFKPSVIGVLRRIFEVEAPMVKYKKVTVVKFPEFSARDNAKVSNLANRMPGLRFQIQLAEGHVDLRFFGELTTDRREKVAEAFSLLTESCAPVVVRLDGVINMDERGMANLIKTAGEFKQKTGVNLVVTAESPVIRRSYTAARGHLVAGFYEDNLKALSAVQSP